jgi:hypothetical protein
MVPLNRRLDKMSLSFVPYRIRVLVGVSFSRGIRFSSTPFSKKGVQFNALVLLVKVENCCSSTDFRPIVMKPCRGRYSKHIEYFFFSVRSYSLWSLICFHIYLVITFYSAWNDSTQYIGRIAPNTYIFSMFLTTPVVH